MIQRYLHKLLTDGIAAINDDIKVLEELFRDDFDLETTEVAAIREYWEAHPLSVVAGYPRADSDFPLIAVVLASENEQTAFVGDVAGQIEDAEDPYFGADLESSIWEHSYQMLIYTGHPDTCAYYYELVKHILVDGLDFLTAQGLFAYGFSGMDLAPDPAYLPEHLFARVLTFKCQREFLMIDRSSRVGKAFAVSGVHVDSSGSPSDVGGVNTNISPYVEGED